MSGATVVNDVSPRSQYIATPGQTVFSFTFPVYAVGDITVFQTPVGTTANDAVNILAQTINYSVTLNAAGTNGGPSIGGTVTLVVGANAGDIITIVRTQADQRLNYYIQGGLFQSPTVNSDFDQDVLMIQQNKMYNQQVNPHYNLCASPDPILDIILPVLGANQVWMKNANNTQIIAFNITSSTVPVVQSTNSVSMVVNQTAHGLSVGNLVRCSGSNTYVKAQADSAAHAEVVGIVSAVADANDFTLLMGGLVNTLSALTPGSVYYLDPASAGGFTATKPTTATQVIKPVFVAISTTAAIWTNLLGVVL